MSAMSSVYIEILTCDLCGSCRLYRGTPETGKLTGFCPVDGKDAGAQNNPCKMYEAEKRRNNDN